MTLQQGAVGVLGCVHMHAGPSLLSWGHMWLRSDHLKMNILLLRCWHVCSCHVLCHFFVQVYVNKTCPARLPAITGDPDWIEKCEEFFLKRNVNVQIDVEQLYPILDQAVADYYPAARTRQTRARRLVQRQQRAQ